MQRVCCNIQQHKQVFLCTELFFLQLFVSFCIQIFGCVHPSIYSRFFIEKPALISVVVVVLCVGCD